MPEKTYVFDNDGGCSNNGMMGILASLCSQRGIDPNLVVSMMGRNGNGFGGEGGWFMWVIFLFFLMGWGGGGWGGFGNRNGQAEGNFLAGQLANDTGRELLQQAIAGNAQAISQLAATLNCDINAVQGSLNQLNQAVCNVGNQVGMSSQQIINAIQAGNCNIAGQIASCCCDVRQQIADFRGDLALQLCNQTNTLQNSINFVNSSVERGFAAEAYERQAQTCRLENVINAQTQAMNAGFAQIKEREDAREIQNLRDQLQACRLSDSQRDQTADIISQLQPVAKPAYLTCSPYQAAYPYGYPYGGYPYGQNNGCCCGQNNGCCNSGCGC